MHSECKTKQSHKAAHHGFAVSGIHKRISQHCQATGEWVGAEKIAERRVATKASQTSQSSPRVFSEIFCSTHPERGARPPTRQVPQQATSASQLGKFPSKQPQPANSASSPASNLSQPTRQVPQQATPASQLGKFPKSTTLAHQRSRLSQSAALVHNAGKHPQTHQP